MAAAVNPIPLNLPEKKKKRESEFISLYRVLDLDLRNEEANSELKGLEEILRVNSRNDSPTDFAALLSPTPTPSAGPCAGPCANVPAAESPKPINRMLSLEPLSQRSGVDPSLSAQMKKMTKNLARPYFWAEIFHLLSPSVSFMQSINMVRHGFNKNLTKQENTLFKEMQSIIRSELNQFLTKIPLDTDRNDFAKLIANNEKLAYALDFPQQGFKVTAADGFKNPDSLRVHWQTFYKEISDKLEKNPLKQLQIKKLQISIQKSKTLVNILKQLSEGLGSLSDNIYTCYSDLYYSQRTAANAFMGSDKGFDLRKFPNHHLVGSLSKEYITKYGTIFDNNPEAERHFEKVMDLCKRLNRSQLSISKCLLAIDYLLDLIGVMKKPIESLNVRDLEVAKAHLQCLRTDIRVHINILVLGLKHRKERWNHLNEMVKDEEYQGALACSEKDIKSSLDDNDPKKKDLSIRHEAEQKELMAQQSKAEIQLAIEQQKELEKLKKEQQHEFDTLIKQHQQSKDRLQEQLLERLSYFKKARMNRINNLEIEARRNEKEKEKWEQFTRPFEMKDFQEKLDVLRRNLEQELKETLHEEELNFQDATNALIKTHRNQMKKLKEGQERRESMLLKKFELEKNELAARHKAERRQLTPEKDSRALGGLLHEQLYPFYYEAFLTELYVKNELFRSSVENDSVFPDFSTYGTEATKKLAEEEDKLKALELMNSLAEKVLRFFRTTQEFNDFNLIAYEDKGKTGEDKKKAEDNTVLTPPAEKPAQHEPLSMEKIKHVMKALVIGIEKDFRALQKYNIDYGNRTIIASVQPDHVEENWLGLGEHFNPSSKQLVHYINQDLYRDYVVTPDLTSQRLFCSFRALTNQIYKGLSPQGLFATDAPDIRHQLNEQALRLVKKMVDIRDIVLEYLLPIEENGDFDMGHHLTQRSLGYLPNVHRFDCLPYLRTAEALIEALSHGFRDLNCLLANKKGAIPVMPESVIRQAKQITPAYSRHTQSFARALKVDAEMERRGLYPEPSGA